ncbi:uncharacterized protein LOC126109386 [Schistocerca cancellata]|uniref:uncharacterized protein LOC126109386 n=1 Tax=Schistocerca cancellata TaxID=274614 RepID=UPI0021186030|nr:uncharacterized protein LOC126109386 [Schistocerca cancellata]
MATTNYLFHPCHTISEDGGSSLHTAILILVFHRLSKLIHEISDGSYYMATTNYLFHPCHTISAVINCSFQPRQDATIWCTPHYAGAVRAASKITGHRLTSFAPAKVRQKFPLPPLPTLTQLSIPDGTTPSFILHVSHTALSECQ